VEVHIAADSCMVRRGKVASEVIDWLPKKR
jgi:hypothetical protein